MLSFGSADSGDDAFMTDGCDGVVEDDCGGGLTGVTGESKGLLEDECSGDSKELLGFIGAGDFVCWNDAGSLSCNDFNFCTRLGRSAHKPIKIKKIRA